MSKHATHDACGAFTMQEAAETFRSLTFQWLFEDFSFYRCEVLHNESVLFYTKKHPTWARKCVTGST